MEASSLDDEALKRKARREALAKKIAGIAAIYAIEKVIESEAEFTLEVPNKSLQNDCPSKAPASSVSYYCARMIIAASVYFCTRVWRKGYRGRR